MDPNTRANISDLAKETKATLEVFSKSIDKRNNTFLKENSKYISELAYNSDKMVRAAITEGVESIDRMAAFNSYNADKKIFYAIIVNTDLSSFKKIIENFPGVQFSSVESYIPTPEKIISKQINFQESSVKNPNTLNIQSTNDQTYKKFVKTAKEKYGYNIGGQK